MDKLPSTLDWSHIQAFVAVADKGSLSAAARLLGLSQPTLGRQIKQLEAELDVTLFHRQARGLALTETGAALLAPARSMSEAARSMSLSAAGRANSLAGTVRLSASLAVSYHFLPPILAELRREEPDIQIELVPSDENLNLLFRECDIALRMVQPEQLDLVARHLGNIELGIFGHRDYVATLPPLRTIDDLLECDLVGYDRDERIVRGLRDFGHHVDRSAFSTRCDERNVYFALVRGGCGIGFAPCPVAESDPNLVRVAPQVPIPPLEVWIAAHEAMRQSPRIRRVWDKLVRELPPKLSQAASA